jgi:hypothetical protein
VLREQRDDRTGAGPRGGGGGGQCGRRAPDSMSPYAWMLMTAPTAAASIMSSTAYLAAD